MLPSQATALPGVPSGCRADIPVEGAPTYVPITTDKVEMPATTNWGVTLSFGELSSATGIPLKNLIRPEPTGVPEPETHEEEPVGAEVKRREGSVVRRRI